MLLVGTEDTIELIFTGESDQIEFDGPPQWVEKRSPDVNVRGFSPMVFTVGGLTGRNRARIATSDSQVADRIYDFCQAGVKDVTNRPSVDGEVISVTELIEALSLEAATLLMTVIIAASEGVESPCSAQDLSITESAKKK
tara:strand:- start:110 stop:529 length:420 start_codon:yes stop_codon:yes gene_type:complete